MSAPGSSHAGSYAGSVVSSRSSSSRRVRVAKGHEAGAGEDLLDRRSTLENGIFGVLFTLSKESSESRVRVRWVLLKIAIDAWQLFTTVVTPAKQGWRLNGRAWGVVSVLSFTWLADLGYGAYLAVLYSMVVLLGINIGLCLWVAWCFKEHKFPVVWPIKVLRVFSSVFFQAFDVTSLNLLQLGFSCHFTGPGEGHMRFQLFPQYSCGSSPHITHAVVSGLSLVLFVAIALLLNMAEVEVNPLSRRPLALGHSGPEVMAFAIKVLLTLVDVFIGWRTVAACCYLALSLALAWQYIRWSANLVPWMNALKSGSSVAIVWCSAMLMLLVFHPGVKAHQMEDWQSALTFAMLAGLAPAFGVGALASWGMMCHLRTSAFKALARAKPETPLSDVCDCLDDPRDVEIVARCCRVWVGPRALDPEAVNRAHQVIKAGLAMFPNSAYMVLLHANFMIDVLGVSQSGSRRIEDARKLNPGLMCRFIMFVRGQQATQKAAGSSANDGSNMDLLGYVEYQRKQRMVIRLHREALQAMCNFWKALDSSSVSFTHLSKALGKIESSVSQAQTAYRVVLESYGNNPKLVRLYGKFLQTIKNDPWGASEYFSEAERLEEAKEGDTRGPLLPDGTPLGRMDELSISVLVLNVTGEVQVANRQTYHLFGHKRGMLEAKPMSALLAPHCASWLSSHLAQLAAESSGLGPAAGPVVGSDAAGAGGGGGTGGGGGALSCSGLAFAAPAAAVPVQPQLQQRLSCTGAGVVVVGGGAAAAAAGGTGAGVSGPRHETVLVGMHTDRLAFPVKVAISRVSGVGDDATMVAMLEPLPPVRGECSLWVASNGTVAACDPQFVATFGWKSGEVHGASITTLLSIAKRDDAGRRHDGGGDVETAAAAAAAKRHAESASDVMRRLQALATAAGAAGKGGDGGDTQSERGLRCLVAHKYDSTPVAGFVKIVTEGAQQESPPVVELRITLGTDPAQLLVVSTKGAVLHVSADLAATLKDAGGAASGGMFGGAAAAGDAGAFGGRPRRASWAAVGAPQSEAAGGMAVGIGGFGFGDAGHGAHGRSALVTEPLAGYTLSDFLPPPWRDMHVKYLKSTTALTAPGRGPWSCRRGGSPGPTLELRTASGKPLFMHVRVDTSEAAGEVNHVVRMESSSLHAALGERRLRLSLTEDGRVAGCSGGAPAHQLGLDPATLVGRGLWELIEESTAAAEGGGAAASPKHGQRLLSNLVTRALMQPEHSWRVRVTPPPKPSRGTVASLAAAARATLAKPAVMQVHVQLPRDDGTAAADQPPDIFVDLWPLPSVSGVLELDGSGRIACLLEESLRPAGLLFGLPGGSLLGSCLEELLELPPGRTGPADLLSLHGTKKSSLKVNRKEASFKVGPVHVLQGVHADGLPLALEVQVVGRPGPNQPLTAILRAHIAPMLPAGVRPTTGAAGGASTGPRASVAAAPSMHGKAKTEVTALQRRYTTGSPAGGASAAGLAAPAGHPSLLLRPKPSADQARLLTPPPPPVPNPSTPPVPRHNPSPNPSQPPTGAVNVTGSGSPRSDDVQAFVSALDGLLAPNTAPANATIGAADSIPPTPPDILATCSSVGLPFPGVTAGKAATLAGRTKLAGLVRSTEVDRASPQAAAAAAAAAASSPIAGSDRDAYRRRRGLSNALLATPPPAAPPAEGEAVLGSMVGIPLEATVEEEPSLPGAMRRTGEGYGAASVPGTSPREAARVPGAQADEDDGDSASDSDARITRRVYTSVTSKVSRAATERISAWVESKGAYYQNSVAAAKADDIDGDGTVPPRSDDNDDADGDTDPWVGRAASQLADAIRPGGGGSVVRLEAVVPELRPTMTMTSATAPGIAMGPSRGAEREGAAYADDDAASEGGQSAMSAQSAGGGAEYKRGKRFRKLAKLMDSSQAQQVQSRFRSHALGVVLLLVTCHIVCFVLTVVFIQSQRTSMLKLGRSGQSQRFMHRIMTDVRSLDLIARNRTAPHLFTADDAPMFLARIKQDVEQVKVRLNEILYGHHNSDSLVMEVLYYNFWQVWAGNQTDGSDRFANVTIWDFGTQFYTYAKEVVQQYDAWRAENVTVSETPAGKFLIKSGPDLWRASRRVLDALLYVAVEDARRVDTLQLAFLAVEGAFITCLAAFYVSYLLRAVAAQRYKLYCTFLVVPVGLTRALASQNTNLLVDEDEDEADDEEDRDRAAAAEPTDPEEDVEGTPAKAKRRATLNVGVDSDGTGGAASIGSPLSRQNSRRSNRSSGAVGGAVGFGAGAGSNTRPGSRGAEGKASGDKALATAGAGPQTKGRQLFGGLGARLFRGIKQTLSRYGGSVNPFGGPLAAGAAGGSQVAKRVLKYDSHETATMMVPFVLWSALVITLYATAVVKMKDVVDVVAVHSVANFLAARTYRTVFFTQELAAVEDPTLLPARRAALATVQKALKDAYYTTLLGANAYKAAGPTTERFPLVKEGLAHATPALQNIFYASGRCHRMEHLPCPGPGYRFYQVIYTGIDSIMQQYLLRVTNLVTSNSTVPPGIMDDDLDFIYNVGAEDLSDGTVEIQDAHYDSIIALFNRILLLHIILFLLLWVIVALFLFVLLNPLLKRVTKERRRIAELMSQLPLELDVEKLVERALGTNLASNDPRVGSGAGLPELPPGAQAADGSMSTNGAFDATSKWKAIIRSASAQLGKMPEGDTSFRKAPA